MKKIFLTLALSIFCFSFAKAGPFTLPVLDPSQVDSVFKTMAADTVFRPVQGADTFGNIFGIAVGITGQMTSTAPMASVIGSGTSYVYATDLNAAVQLPLGLA